MLGVETVELKWGQGAKCIGGEIKIRDLDRAIELRKRGYIITPNPSLPSVQQAYENGGIKEFERQSRLGFIDEDQFLRTDESLKFRPPPHNFPRTQGRDRCARSVRG